MSALDRAISIPWMVFDITGQWCLVGLLLTFAFARDLPQRKNPYLINFIFTAFLATIPPALLVYAGKEHGKEPLSLCLAQVALMNGTATSFGVAQLLLVFDTWSELRSSGLRVSHFTRKLGINCLLMVAPYISLLIWTVVSLRGNYSDHIGHDDTLLFCRISGPTASALSSAVGWFMSVIGLVGLFFEIWVCWMIYSYPALAQRDPLVWRTSIQFALRVIIYSFMLFIVVTISLLNMIFHNPKVKAAYMVLNSMNALFVFFVFGTQKSILRVWKFWDRFKTSPSMDEFDIEPQLQGYPRMRWAPPATKSEPFDGRGFDYEEKGHRASHSSRKLRKSSYG